MYAYSAMLFGLSFYILHFTFDAFAALPLVVFAVIVVVVTSSPQLPGSLSSGGLLGLELHHWQGFLSREQEEWRMQELGKAE